MGCISDTGSLWVRVNKALQPDSLVASVGPGFPVSVDVLISTFCPQCVPCTVTRVLIYGVAYYSVFISQ